MQRQINQVTYSKIVYYKQHRWCVRRQFCSHMLVIIIVIILILSTAIRLRNESTTAVVFVRM